MEISSKYNILKIKEYLNQKEENILKSPNKSHFYEYINSKLSTRASCPKQLTKGLSNDLDKAK